MIRLTAWGEFTLARLGRDTRVRQKADLSLIVGKIIDELEPSFTQIRAKIKRHLYAVTSRIFPSDLESLTLNLMTNAYAACKQGADRRICVSLQPADEDHAVLIVSDSGPGVAPENRDRIWEPLFTTKVDSSGRPVGTGLGLSIVRSIVEDMRGTVTVDKDPDLQGARFVVTIPLRKERT